MAGLRLRGRPLSDGPTTPGKCRSRVPLHRVDRTEPQRERRYPVRTGCSPAQEPALSCTMGLVAMPGVRRLRLSTIELPESHPAAHLGRSVPVYGFLVEHPDGPIVVDTGVGYGNEFIDELYGPTRTRLQDALEEWKVAAADVVAVVNSHLHFDHCGQNPLLFSTRSTFFAQAAEFEAAETVAHYTDPAWALAPEAQRRSVNGDEEIAEGVTILASPGHTAGHQSVLIEAGDERVVIGAQMVWNAVEYDNETASEANVDPDPALRQAAVQSIRRIKSLQPSAIYFSHCATEPGH